MEQIDGTDWPSLYRHVGCAACGKTGLPGPVRAPRGDAHDRGDRAADHRAALDRRHQEDRGHAGDDHAAGRRPPQGRRRARPASKRSSASSPDLVRLRRRSAGPAPADASSGRRCSRAGTTGRVQVLASQAAGPRRVPGRSSRLVSRRSRRSRWPSRAGPGDPLPAVLHRNGLVSEKDLTAAIAETVGLRFVDFTEQPAAPRRGRRPSAEAVAREHVAIGVDFEGTKLVVAFADPGDDDAVQAVGAATGYEIIPPRPRSLRAPARDRLRLRRRPHADAPSLDEPESFGIDDEPEGLHVNELLERARWSGRAPTSTSTAGQPAGDPGARRAARDARHRRSINGSADPGDDLRDPHAEAAGEVRERARARLLVHACRARAASA